MAVTYRTDGAWGSGKGTNLTPAEVDGNFYDVDTRVSTIEDNPVEPIAPIAINIEGSAFTMGLSNGDTLGPIAITYPMPTWRGNWAPSIAYHEMDFFIAPDGGLGAVMIPHTSAATFDWAAIDTGSGLSIYRKLIGGSGSTLALDGLTDVTLTSVSNGQLLSYDATAGYWKNATVGSGTGTVTSVATGAGLTGGPVTTTGTISLDTIANQRLLANIGGTTAAPIANTMTAILDAVFSTTRGSLLYRGSGGWAALAPGTDGTVLTTHGTSADPAWAAAAGGGASISIADTPPASPTAGALWWDSVGGQLYLWYNDGSSSQWVPTSNQPGPTGPSGTSGPWTVGSIPFANTTSSLAQDNPNLFFDDTNNRLGIGTAAPAYPLDVNGAICSRNGQLWLDTASDKLIYDAGSNAVGLRAGSVGGGYAYYVFLASGQFQCQSGGASFAGHIVPSGDNFYTSGASGARWSAVWAATGTIQTSDGSAKTEIEKCDLGLDFISALEPVSWRYRIGGYELVDGASVEVPGVRRHYGLVAQQVKEALGDKDFAGWVLTDKDDPDSEQALRYDQFVAPLIMAVQQQQEMIEALEARLSVLEARP